MKIGIKFQTGAFWLGVHYSDYTKRFCINVIPFCTVWITRKGGKIPQ